MTDRASARVGQGISAAGEGSLGALVEPIPGIDRGVWAGANRHRDADSDGMGVAVCAAIAGGLIRHFAAAVFQTPGPVLPSDLYQSYYQDREDQLHGARSAGRARALGAIAVPR